MYYLNGYKKVLVCKNDVFDGLAVYKILLSRLKVTHNPGLDF